ncbi:MAG: SMC-Scp complex subunit ScpB [Nitrospirae bacterium]|nr:MAG: SMC-Scp complex subunit ScpB [Nitrospirota bacterium]
MEQKKKKALIEALIFVSGTPLSIKEIQKVTGFPSGEIEFLLRELMADYRNRESGLEIVEVAEGFQMVTRAEFSDYIRKLKSSTPPKLSAPAMETLAIIAYKQPITKAEVEEIRGVNSAGVIKNLLDRRLIRVVGKKEAPGRPLLYGTTREFLLYFGLKDLSELPTIRELNPEEL